MKKKVVFAAAITLTLATIMIASAFAISNCNIRLGNEYVTMQYPVLMKNDRLYVSIRNICDLLGIPIYWSEQENEVYMDIYNKKVPISDKTEYKKEGVIPDEETALGVGKTILEKYVERSMEYETEDKIYYLEVEFLEQINAWRIYQTFKYKKGGEWFTGDNFYVPMITLNKSSGEVMFLNTYSMFKE